MRTLTYACYNLTSLLNGINSNCRCINSKFFLVVRRPRPPSSSSPVLIIRRRLCRILSSSAAWWVSISCWLPSFRILHIFGPTLPHFTNALRTAHLDYPLASPSAAVVSTVNADTAVGGSLCRVPPLTTSGVRVL